MISYLDTSYGWEVCTWNVHYDWSTVLASINVVTSLKSQLSTVPLPDNCVMTPVFQEGSLPFHHTHKHSSPLRQALHTQIANHHIQATKSFYCVFFCCCCFFKCWRIFSKFRPATWKCRQTTTKGHRPHQRDTPPGCCLLYTSPSPRD